MDLLPDDLVDVGFCARPHGIKGAFHFVLGNEEDSVLEDGSEVYLFPSKDKSNLPPTGKKFVIEKITFGHKVMVYLEGINDRSVVESMLPFTVKIPRSSFPEAKDGEVYITDVIGAKAFNADSGEEIGEVVDFYDNSAQLVLKIKTKEGIQEIPFVDQFVTEVDIEKNRISVRLLEYI